MDLQVQGKNYEIEGAWNRTKTGNDGKLEINLVFNYLMKSLIITNLYFNIGYGKRSYFIKQAELNQKLFDHTISGYIDYDKVDPTAQDYAASFNNQSHFIISENNRGIVGDIVLATIENDELLDYHIEFSDGSKELFGKYIPLIDKIFNFKY
jgi:hypothetical protein